MSIGAVVLAAGQGTRMRSALPKVVHPLAGRPMVGWVLDALEGGGVAHTVVVVGHGAEVVRDALPAGVAVAVQERAAAAPATRPRSGWPRSTPRATPSSSPAATPRCCRAELVARLVAEHTAEERAATMLTAVVDDAAAYGRVVRDGDGTRGPGGRGARRVARRARHRRVQRRALRVRPRRPGPPCSSGLGSGNAQGEIYLTDVLERSRRHGRRPGRRRPRGRGGRQRPRRPVGVRGRPPGAPARRADAGRRHDARPGRRCYVEAGVSVGRDTVLLPGTHLRGATTIGEGCTIGPDAVDLRHARSASGCTVVSAHVLGVRARRRHPGRALRLPAPRQPSGGAARASARTSSSRTRRSARAPRCPTSPTSATPPWARAPTSAPATSPPTTTASASTARRSAPASRPARTACSWRR